MQDSKLQFPRVGASLRSEKADSTLRSSQAVPHPSTNRALRRLTSEVGRDPVYSTRYGRQRSVRSAAAWHKPAAECREEVAPRKPTQNLHFRVM